MFSLSPLEIEAVQLSLKVSLWAVGISLPFGIAVAWLLARREFPGKSLFDALVHVPLVVPPVVIGHGCVVQPGATIGPYAVVGDGWNIGAGATVRNSVLWEPSPIFNDDGKELGAAQRASLDPHTVADGVTIEESIVAGGAVTSDLREATQVVGLDGVADVRGLGWVPSGPRA